MAWNVQDKLQQIDKQQRHLLATVRQEVENIEHSRHGVMDSYKQERERLVETEKNIIDLERHLSGNSDDKSQLSPALDITETFPEDIRPGDALTDVQLVKRTTSKDNDSPAGMYNIVVNRS